MRKTCGVSSVTAICAAGNTPDGVVTTTSAGVKLLALIAVSKMASTALTPCGTAPAGVTASRTGTTLATESPR